MESGSTIAGGRRSDTHLVCFHITDDSLIATLALTPHRIAHVFRPAVAAERTYRIHISHLLTA